MDFEENRGTICYSAKGATFCQRDELKLFEQYSQIIVSPIVSSRGVFAFSIMLSIRVDAELSSVFHRMAGM